MAEIKIRITLDGEDAKKDVKELTIDFEKLGNKLSNLGNRVTSAFTAPIVGAFRLVLSQSKELQAAFQPIQGAFAGVAAELGSALVPVIQELTPAIMDIAGALGDAAHWFSQLNTGTKTIIVGFVGMVAAIGPLLNGLGAVAGLVDLFTSLGVALPGLGAAFTTFGATAAAALAPLLPLAIAIGGLIALVNSEFGQRGITAGKQLLAIGAGGIGAAFGGLDAGKSAFMQTSSDLGLLSSGAPGASAAPTVIYNNYGVDTSNPYARKALEPFINQSLRNGGLR